MVADKVASLLAIFSEFCVGGSWLMSCWSAMSRAAAKTTELFSTRSMMRQPFEVCFL